MLFARLKFIAALRMVPLVLQAEVRYVRTLVIDAPGILDVADNDMIVGNGTSKAQVQAYINTARDGGDWDGYGLTSSTALNDPSFATTLGVLSGTEYTSVGGGGTFAGVGYLSGDTLVKYTWYGDTDFNGVVNFDDYVRTDNGYNNALAGWLNGDFDGNGTVNFDDYVLIDLAFNEQNGALRPGEGGGESAWAQIAEMDHFQLEGYEDYLIGALSQFGITVTHDDFHP